MRFGRIVFSRLEYVWLAPHPPLGVLQRGVLWIPEDGATSKYTRSKYTGCSGSPRTVRRPATYYQSLQPATARSLQQPATCYSM